MKALLLICCLFASVRVIAQTPQAIEADLVKAYKKLPELEAQGENDLLEDANDALAAKLKEYTAKYPATITYPFAALSKNLQISRAADGLFRIYSWDTLTGGSMRYYNNVFQYKAGNRVVSVLDVPKGEGDNRPNYYKMYTFNANNHTYYLAVWREIGSGTDGTNGAEVYTIANRKLTKARIIKTSAGLNDQLHYDYHTGWNEKFEINFDAASKTLSLPLLAANNKPGGKLVSYKFMGEYFERVK